MRILVIGGGAREHALCQALSQDPGVSGLHCAPGNAGIEQLATVHQVTPTDGAAVVRLAEETGAALVVIGPEGPLVEGVADAVRAAGVAVFGPSAAAARLEGSKAFAKEVMAAAQVPTARSYVCTTEAQAEAALDAFGPPYVVKDDGLAAGKGVVVTDDLQTAQDHAAACEQVVIEEYLDGPEVSLFAVTDGTTVVPLRPAQDFKRALDGDRGPNTGGMGAYSPLPWAAPGLTEEVLQTVLQPTVDELRRRGTPFCGLLYAGLALTSRGVRVVEFNARFGDPETQVVLARLRSPLAGLLYATATGELATHPPLRWSQDAAVTVVVAAERYPGTPRTGDEIGGLDAAAATAPGVGVDVPGGVAAGPVQVLHAGTRRDETGRVLSSGGRVLSVTATGDDLTQARERAYRATAEIQLSGCHYRTDIAENAAEAP